MTTTMVAHRTATITRDVIIAASTLVRVTHPTDSSMHRALGKAETLMLDMSWTIERGMLVIDSASEPGDVRRTDGETCSCPTSKGVCWHRAAWHMLSAIAATGLNPMAPKPLQLPATFHVAEALDDYPGNFLDSLAQDAATGWDEYGDVLPDELIITPASTYFEEVDVLLPFSRRSRPAPALPMRPLTSRVMVPAPGSDFERAQALADLMMAA